MGASPIGQVPPRLVFQRLSRYDTKRLAEQKASCRQVRDITAPRLADIRARLRDLKKMERVLASTLSRCSGKDVPECPILDVLDVQRTERCAAGGVAPS